MNKLPKLRWQASGQTNVEHISPAGLRVRNIVLHADASIVEADLSAAIHEQAEGAVQAAVEETLRGEKRQALLKDQERLAELETARDRHAVEVAAQQRTAEAARQKIIATMGGVELVEALAAHNEQTGWEAASLRTKQEAFETAIRAVQNEIARHRAALSQAAAVAAQRACRKATEAVTAAREQAVRALGEAASPALTELTIAARAFARLSDTGMPDRLVAAAMSSVG